MADIELVIRISEEVYKKAKETHDVMCDSVWLGIKYGTPLPKGHGDLIDRSKIVKAIPAEEDNCTGMGMTYDEMDAYNDGINSMFELVQNTKPLIKADKVESEEK